MKFIIAVISRKEQRGINEEYSQFEVTNSLNVLVMFSVLRLSMDSRVFVYMLNVFFYMHHYLHNFIPWCVQ